MPIYRLLTEIQTYIENLHSKTLLEQFLRHSGKTTRLNYLGSQLTALATDLHIAISRDDRDEQAAQAADSTALNSKLEKFLRTPTSS